MSVKSDRWIKRVARDIYTRDEFLWRCLDWLSRQKDSLVRLDQFSYRRYGSLLHRAAYGLLCRQRSQASIVGSTADNRVLGDFINRRFTAGSDCCSRPYAISFKGQSRLQWWSLSSFETSTRTPSGPQARRRPLPRARERTACRFQGSNSPRSSRTTSRICKNAMCYQAIPLASGTCQFDDRRTRSWTRALLLMELEVFARG
jgi:hypothetical protein